MPFKKYCLFLLVPFLLIVFAVWLLFYLNQAPDIEPYLGASAIKSAKIDGDKLTLTSKTSTVFSNRHDNDPGSQERVNEMYISFNEHTVQADLIDTWPDLRRGSPDGSYMDTSTVVNTWRAVFQETNDFNDLQDGKYLVVMKGCRTGKRDCQLSAVPVCEQKSQIIGEPGNTGNGEPDARRYGAGDSKSWNENYTCAQTRWGSLSAAYNSAAEYEPPNLPNDWAERIGPFN